MTEFYGAAFASQYGDEPSLTWASALRDLSAADYGVGFEGLRTRQNPFPPNPAEFLALAKPSTWEHHRQSGTHLPGIEFNPSVEFRLEQLKKLRERHGL